MVPERAYKRGTYHTTNQRYRDFFKRLIGKNGSRNLLIGTSPKKWHDCDPPLYHIKMRTHIFAVFCIMFSGGE